MTSRSLSSFSFSRESGTAVKRSLLLLPALALFAGCAVDTGTVTDGNPSTTTFSAADRVIESTTSAPIAPIGEPITADQRAGKLISQVAADEGIIIDQHMAAKYAEIVCEGFDDDMPFSHMVIATTAGLPRFSDREHAYLIGASIGAMCPEHAASVGGL